MRPLLILTRNAAPNLNAGHHNSIIIWSRYLRLIYGAYWYLVEKQKMAFQKSMVYSSSLQVAYTSYETRVVQIKHQTASSHYSPPIILMTTHT